MLIYSAHQFSWDQSTREYKDLLNGDLRDLGWPAFSPLVILEGGEQAVVYCLERIKRESSNREGVWGNVFGSRKWCPSGA